MPEMPEELSMNLISEESKAVYRNVLIAYSDGLQKKRKQLDLEILLVEEELLATYV